MRKVTFADLAEPQVYKTYNVFLPNKEGWEGWTWGHTSYDWTPRDLRKFK